MTRILPPFLQEMLAALPPAGEGVHYWLYRTARQLHAHLPAAEIVALLEARVADCGRPVPREEILQAVQNSLPYAWQPGRNGKKKPAAPKWPEKNLEQIEAICAEGYGLTD